MFGPRHTIESVTKELVDGLEERTIVLRLEDSTKVDIEDFESRIRTSLARYRRREILLLSLSALSAVASIVVVLMLVFLHPEGQEQTRDPNSLWLTVLGCIIGTLMGFVAGYR